MYAYNANETTHSESEIPWYHPLCGSFLSVSGFRQTRLGRVCTHGLVCTLELFRIAPKGSAQVRIALLVVDHVLSGVVVFLVIGGLLSSIYIPPCTLAGIILRHNINAVHASAAL